MPSAIRAELGARRRRARASRGAPRRAAPRPRTRRRRAPRGRGRSASARRGAPARRRGRRWRARARTSTAAARRPPPARARRAAACRRRRRPRLRGVAVLGLEHADVPVEHEPGQRPPDDEGARAAGERLAARERERRPGGRAERRSRRASGARSAGRAARCSRARRWLAARKRAIARGVKPRVAQQRELLARPQLAGGERRQISVPKTSSTCCQPTCSRNRLLRP